MTLKSIYIVSIKNCYFLDISIFRLKHGKRFSSNFLPSNLDVAWFNPLQDGAEGTKRPACPTSFSPVTSTKVEISTQKLSDF